ncbi:MmgE/PrpD family protein [Dehalococcoidia bacterium]|nr:MmgE/PrpD family protein [Dehalococcoidia bacterium]
MIAGNIVDGSAIDRLGQYMVTALATKLPEDVATKAKHHILDTIAAMVSGAGLEPGKLAIKYVETLGGTHEAKVIGSHIVTTAVNAAFANGIMAHADETDDSHAPSGTHPGCAVVPAALAMAERADTDGHSLLNAVVLGYDVGCRLMRALGGPQSQGGVTRNLSSGRRFSSHSVGGVFGAGAAAGALANLNATEVRYLFSYVAQQASGIMSWQLDTDHIEKAFDFAGMPARSGVAAATMVQAGFTGVWDVFEGLNNFLESFSANPQPEELVGGLGSRYEIMFTNIKKYCVGSPIQAPVDALLNIMQEYQVGADECHHIVAVTPGGENRLTGGEQTMPDINMRYLLAATLLDGDLSFQASHDPTRMKNPDIVDICNRIEMRADSSLVTPESPRQGVIEFTTIDGRTLRNHVVKVRGAMENPMTTAEVEKKARELLVPSLGFDRADDLIAVVRDLESLASVRELRSMLV